MKYKYQKRYLLPFVICLLATFPMLGQLSFPGLLSDSGQEIDYANPKEYTIKDIHVTGTKYLDESALIGISGLHQGQKIRLPGEDISSTIRKLWKKGILGDIQIFASKIEGNEVTLTIDLKERPRLSRFYFQGIPKGQIETLEDKIKTLQIRGRIVNETMLERTKKTIEEHYKEKGFYHAKVDIQQQPDTILANSVVLKININKNKKVKINRMRIEGVNEFSLKKIKRKFKKTKEKKFWRIFTPSKYYDDRLEEDKEKLTTFYHKSGYRDFRIISDTVYTHSEGLVNVDIRLFEGKKYYYRNIKWTGNHKYSDDQLSHILSIQKGDIYNPEDLQKRLSFNPAGDDITSLYMDDGYLFFTIKPIETKVVGDSLDLEMRIFEGEQANINKVTVGGNTKTNDHVIFREITTFPSDKFSRSNIIRTQRELSNLKYFDPEEMGISPQPNFNDGTVDISYDLTEKSSDQIELSGGWGGALGFVGTLGLVFGNFSAKRMFKKNAWRPVPTGDGQRLALRFQSSGRRFQTYSINFSEPWLGGRRPNTFSINLQLSVQHRLNKSLKSIGNIVIGGGSVSLGRRLTKPDDYFNMSNSLRYLQYKLTNYKDVGFGNYNNGLSHNITFNTTFARNNVDNPLFPRFGSSLALNLSLTPPYSLFSKETEEISDEDRFKYVEYYKVIFDNKWYQSIVGNLVFALRSHIGLLQPYSQDKELGPFERFKMGGDGLAQNFGTLIGADIIGLRGYSNNSILPLDDEGINQTGGIAFVKYVAELRYAVSLKPQATIYVHTFMEAGNNWGSADEFDPFNVYRSAGFGARIFMPAFGMLGFDWGYGFDTVKGSLNAGGSRFHFIIGQPIR